MILLALCGTAFGQLPDLNEPNTTQKKSSIKFQGGVLAYTATTGTLALKNDAGEAEGEMFYTAYTKDGADVSTRPVTFCYNGGPGSSSIWLHMGTIGPRRTDFKDDGTLPKPPFKIVDNQETWLDVTDVVIVDAPGAGFSRVPKPENNGKFYGVRQDLDAFVRFIRRYLAKYNRFSSPIYLAGESYGGVRTAGLLSQLLDSGIAVSGAIIISGAMDFATLDRSTSGVDLPYIGFLPSLTATAWYHKKLSPRLQKSLPATLKEAEEFALGDFASALVKGTRLTPAEFDRIAKRYADLTGLSEKFVKQCNLRVNEFRFFKELLRDEDKIIGRLDGRITATDPLPIGDGPSDDPSSTAITAPIFSTWQEYFANELGYKTDQRYRIFNDTAGSWPSNQNDGPIDTSGQLRDALLKNPHLKVLFTCGYFDLACPYFATQYTVNHLDLRKAQLDRISWTYYPAGHMMYIEKSSREKLAKDVRAFFKAG